MARINVEDELLLDPRFQALTRRLGGDIEKAVGRLVRFWWAAQRHWGHDKNLIPLEEFKVGDFDYLIDVGLAERREQGIYAKGSEQYFDWYLSRIASAKVAGKASAAARIAKYGTAIPPNASNRTTPEQDPNDRSDDVERMVEPTFEYAAERFPNAPNPPTPPPTPSLSLINKTSGILGGGGPGSASPNPDVPKKKDSASSTRTPPSGCERPSPG